jgi:hypothetical protein
MLLVLVCDCSALEIRPARPTGLILVHDSLVRGAEQAYSGPATVMVLTDSQWLALTTQDFAQAGVLWLGDGSLQLSSYGVVISSKSEWQPAVRAIVASRFDACNHWLDGSSVAYLNAALDWLLELKTTGLLLGTDMRTGGFAFLESDYGISACYSGCQGGDDNRFRVGPRGVAWQGLSDFDISGWNQAVHAAWHYVPSSWAVLADTHISPGWSLPCLAVTSLDWPECRVCGDVDLDGYVTILDAWRVLCVVVGVCLQPPTPYAVACADVNRDSIVDVLDALLIAQYSAGLPVVLECS